jgi:predicted ATPase
LLVLDNCEHVVSAVADLDEVSYRLAPLPVVGPDANRAEIDASPAVRLFRERAGARTQASLDTDRAGRLLGEICRRVDGLPLAIELAAARVAGLDLVELAARAGMTQPALSRLEAGGVVPTIPLLERISMALNADLIVEIAPHAA